ncbi:MAG: hypothetical protein RMH97_00395 [Verrucomicrobiales bacterium]|nr:hypothetical protein [Verrucomicrobiales bacterium]
MEIITRPGIYVIEGPMGFGKTEAALAAAYKLIEAGCANGLYFALPTRVTSDRIHKRVQPFVNQICAEAEQVPLVHSASLLPGTAAALQLLNLRSKMPGAKTTNTRVPAGCGLAHPNVRCLPPSASVRLIKPY